MKPIGTVEEILRRKGRSVWSVPPDMTVFQAVTVLSEKNVGALLVLEGDQLVGMISERDYARKIALMGKSSKDTLVREIMQDNVICTAPRSTVADCMRVMTKQRIRHLPVVQGDRVEGIVSIGDLVNWIISAQEAMINQLENYISGKYPG